MNRAYILEGAVLSEKTYKQMEVGTFTFLVAAKATKNQIAKSIENQFGVKVKKVNLAKKPAKEKRIMGSRKMTLTGGRRKALVYLEKGQTIELLTPKKETGKKSKTKNQNAK